MKHRWENDAGRKRKEIERKKGGGGTEEEKGKRNPSMTNLLSCIWEYTDSLKRKEKKYIYIPYGSARLS